MSNDVVYFDENDNMYYKDEVVDLDNKIKKR